MKQKKPWKSIHVLLLVCVVKSIHLVLHNEAGITNEVFSIFNVPCLEENMLKNIKGFQKV